MPDLTIRKLDQATYDDFRRAASARGITQADYLSRLVRLHTAMRPLGDPESDTGFHSTVKRELEALGLQTIHS